ncbi:MAG: pentapeptide repeat-containing protein [Deltaproteobacteria bacterium]|jgi:uncharacterized protein YjbI with pentapeptide repeats|nr:pentapeptide repeat-containing protein [Deltaproteobacteria bacterium]
MKIIAAQSLYVSSLNYRLAGRDYLALTMGLGFSLLDGALLEPKIAYGAAIEALTPYQAQGLVFDLGLAKKRGEFLVLGQAQTVKPQSTPLRVAIEVGPLKREFAVLPEEYVDGRLKPFKALPLSWSLAEFDAEGNVFGIKPKGSQGAAGVLARAQVFEYEPHPQGGLELMGQVRPGPASPLPKPPPANLGHWGTFDQAWLKTSWPGFPQDFDFGFFNLAQEAQRLSSGYFWGDEPISLLNLHRQRVIKARLPGLRARVVAKKEAEVWEAPTFLDTVWLFPTQEMAIILWKASLPVIDERNTDLDLLVLTLEPLNAPPESAVSLLSRAERRELWEPQLVPPLNAPESSPRKEPQPPPKAESPLSPSTPEVVLGQAIQLAKGFAALTVTEDLITAARANLVEEKAQLMGAREDSLAETEGIQNVLKALALIPPVKADFVLEADFVKAAAAFGQKWSSLLGLSPRIGAELGQKLILAESSEPAEIAAVWADLEKDQELAKILTSLEPPKVHWSQIGLSPEKQNSREAALAHLDQAAARARNRPWAEKVKALKAVAKELAGSLGLSLVQSLDKVTQNLKSLVWGFGDVADILKGEAIKGGPLSAELATHLPKLTPLFKNPPLEANSLVDLGLMVGLSPKALQFLADLDVLNPPPTAQVEAPQDKDSATLVFSDRQTVIERLADPLANFVGGAMIGLDLSGLDFSGRDLSGADLRETSLSGANLSQTSLKGAILSGGNLSDANLEGSDLGEADLTGVNFGAAQIARADFTGANLSQANLEKVALELFVAPKAYFSQTLLPKNLAGANLSQASFRSLNLAGGDLSLANLDGADFDQAHLRAANLRGASLAKANFSACDLTGLKGQEIQAPGLRIMSCGDLGPSDFRGADLTDLLLSQTEANGANFQGATLDRANLGQTSLAGADFSGASLKEAVLFQSDLSRAKATGANLFKAVLGGSNLKGANFSGASLYASDLYRAQKDDLTNFSGADLGDTCWSASAGLKPQ